MWKARPGLKRRFERNRGGAALLIVALTLAGVATGGPSSAAAQGGPALLQLFPADLALARGEKTKVVAVARNPGSDVLRDVTLEVITGDGLVADPTSVELGTLAAGADRSQLFGLASTGVLSSVPVRFVLRYNTGHDDRSRSHAVVTQLAVTERKPAQDDGLARVTLKTEVVEISDRRGGDIAVLTENTSAFPITVEEISGFGPSHVTVCTADGGSAPPSSGATGACKGGTASAVQPRTRIEPRGVAVQSFTVRGVRRQITQGKQSVVFVVRVTTQVDDPNLRRTDALVADRTIDVKVFGESDLLTPLGIGSFLLLPGLLIVVVFLGLRARTTRAAAPASGGQGGAVGQKIGQLVNPEFWAWSIALSIGVVVLYSLLFGRDLRDGYDSDDLFKVWTGCVLLGLVAWAVVFSWVRWRHPVFSVEDEPSKVVAKLARLDSKLTFSQATIDQGATKILGLLVGELADGKALLAPRIAYEFGGGPDRLKAWFRKGADGDEARAVRRRYLVMKLLPGPSVRLRWDAQGVWAASSQAVDPATATKSGVRLTLLREQP